MQIADEIVTVVFRETHERSSHHNELHFVNTVTQLLQLMTHTYTDYTFMNNY